MPKVGKGQKAVEYPYSKKGIKDAIAHAKRTGESVEMEYGHGGMVKPMMPMYKNGGKVMPKYAGGGMVMSPAQKMAMANRIAKMMYGGKVKKKSK